MTRYEAWAHEIWGFGTETHTLKLRPPKDHILEKGDQKKDQSAYLYGEVSRNGHWRWAGRRKSFFLVIYNHGHPFT